MKNLSLNAKIAFVMSIFVAACIGISTLGIYKMATLNDSLNLLVDVYVKRVDLAKDMELLSTEIRVQERNLILENVENAKTRTTLIDETETKLKGVVGEFSSMATEDGKKDAGEILANLSNWRGIHEDVRKLVLAGRTAEATELAMTKSRLAMQAVGGIAEKISQRNDEFMGIAEKDAAELYQSSRSIVIMISFVAILTGMILAFFILRALGRSIDSVIQSLNDSSAQVTSAAQQIAASSEELSQATTEQASSLEETSSAVEEMNSMVRKNADTAKESTEVSDMSGTSAIKGKQVVEDMMRSMDAINQSNMDIMKQTNDSNQKISEIVRVISEIGEKTKVINDIVFQTKLLSFNASVEAARAGEHGKGFAVVAEEVGNLAQMSGNAAKEITTMLDSSIKTVETIVAETKTGIERLISQSKDKVESGTRVARECGDVLEEIVRNVTQVSHMSKSISVASDEQARGINEITKAVGQLDQVTQQNAAASEETASAAEELSAQAETMHGVVESLIMTIKGSRGQHAQSVKPTKASVTRSKATQDTKAQHGQAGQVIPFESKKTAKGRPIQKPGEQPMRAAVGSDLVPSEDDPRFEEV